MVGTITKSPRNLARGSGGGDRGFGDGGGGSSPEGGGFAFFSTKQIGLWLALATITMLFAGISSALIVRRGGADWKSLYFPPILWLNTATLLLSSFSLEMSRISLRRENAAGYRGWLGFTTFLGLGFLVGQISAWRALNARGVFLPTNPHSSFFYLITCVHALHLMAGIIWMAGAYLGSSRARIQEESSLSLLATYWHYLDALWIYLLVVLFVW